MSAIILFIVLTVGVPLSAATKDSALSLEPYEFRSGDGTTTPAELGHLLVKENRRNPNSRQIRLTFVRFKSTASRPLYPIVYLAGGPGSSGIAAARGNRFALFMELRKVADVIALDQRGTGESEPDLTCTEVPHPERVSVSAIVDAMKQASGKCAERLRRSGVDLSGYNTNESADDLESLRLALGAEKFNLLSISYGTHLALAMIRRHEQNIDRAILAGTEGPDHTLKLPENTQSVLEEFERLSNKDGKQNAFRFLSVLKETLSELEKHPKNVEVTDPQTKRSVEIVIGKPEAQLSLSLSLRQAKDLPFLCQAAHRMKQGDYEMIAGRMLQLQSWPLGSAMPYAMDCASGASDSRIKRIDEQQQKTLLGRAVDFPFPEICAAWNVPDLGPEFRSPVRSSIPTLFISGTLDARTPPVNAEETRKYFPAGHHLILKNAGHSDDLLLSSPQIGIEMLKFLQGESALMNQIEIPVSSDILCTETDQTN